jgi:hypothetical protein
VRTFASFVVIGLLLLSWATPASAQLLDHKHSFQKHHGGYLGQASRPSVGHAIGQDGLDRVNHRHHVYARRNHCGHDEVICDRCRCACERSEPAKQTYAQEPTHEQAAARGERASEQCCRGGHKVTVEVPRGYPEPNGYGYYDEDEVRMDYAFHHLTSRQLAEEGARLEEAGLIPAGSRRDSVRLQWMIDRLRACGFDPRASVTREELIAGMEQAATAATAKVVKAKSKKARKESKAKAKTKAPSKPMASKPAAETPSPEDPTVEQ